MAYKGKGIAQWIGLLDMIETRSGLAISLHVISSVTNQVAITDSLYCKKNLYFSHALYFANFAP